MIRTSAFTTGFVVCVVLGLADVVGVAGVGTDAAPPLVVLVLGGVFGLATLAAAVPAWRGNRAGRLTIVVSRVLSGLLAIPAFFVDAPAWARLVAAVSIVLTVAGVGLMVSGARQRALAR
ncbi:hypothetical protein ABJI51_11875 [Amycolatopsis sp. NEAU-NG30]|uniref:Major facilitator superfamily (MFS) profile domain-containing protein n=1 Tax=Amycolatopsis melonis TaxID=3156488 RepID=A0ABV0LBW6_9PSEU